MSNQNPIARWSSAALLAAAMVCVSPAAAQSCENLPNYGAYALCRVAAGQKPVSAAVWVQARQAKGVLPLAAVGSPGNQIALDPYRAERARHDQLRARADELSQSPKMQRYQSRANDMKADDDRSVKEFDRQAAATGGVAVALPALKRHDDKLDRILAQVESAVKP